MTLAIMQPYLFPYIGYFQLVHASDSFVFYDDVNFIKQGWINRNRILLNGNDLLFTVPVDGQSSFSKICETGINYKLYEGWKNKFLKTLEQAYRKAPFYQEVFPLVKEVFDNEYDSIAGMAKASILATCNYLGLKREFVHSSTTYNNDHLKAQERVLDICKKNGAEKYVNPPGGFELYNKQDFTEQGIELCFVKTDPGISYEQRGNIFIPGLSIIDVMMFNDKQAISSMLTKYSFY